MVCSEREEKAESREIGVSSTQGISNQREVLGRASSSTRGNGDPRERKKEEVGYREEKPANRQRILKELSNL